jgi:uncharacterized membrane protein YbaN (DUF454 family)
MAYVVGVVLALATALFAAVVGLDRDRAFYPTVVIVVASYYVLFAATGGATGGATGALLPETLVMAGFVAVAIAGFRRSLPLVAAALLAHGLFDAVHGRVIENPGVPASWPAFCLAFDITLAAFVAWRLHRAHVADDLRPEPESGDGGLHRLPDRS